MRRRSQLERLRRRQHAQADGAPDDPDDAEDQRGQLRRTPDGHLLVLPSRRGCASRRCPTSMSSTAAGAARSERRDRAGIRSRRCRMTCSTTYIQAVGGAQKAAAVTGFAATGTNVGYGPESADKRQTELYVKASRAAAQRSSFTPATATTRRPSTARNAWYAAPLRPVDVLPLAGQELEGAKIDAMLHFPAQIKQIAPRWRVGRRRRSTTRTSTSCRATPPAA